MSDGRQASSGNDGIPFRRRANWWYVNTSCRQTISMSPAPISAAIAANRSALWVPFSGNPCTFRVATVRCVVMVRHIVAMGDGHAVGADRVRRWFSLMSPLSCLVAVGFGAVR